MEDVETELAVSEPEALGADFITVELDTPQPVEYVVKWAEVGSKFTISCVKKDGSEDGFMPGEIKPEPDETFFATYESVYPECIVEESVEVPPADDDDDEDQDDDDGLRGGFDDQMEAGSSLLQHHPHHDPADEVLAAPPRWRGAGTTATPGRTGTRAPKGSGSHACHVCGKFYSHSSSLSRHVQTHRRGMAKGGAQSVAHPHPHHVAAMANRHKEEYGKPGEVKKTLVCNVCGVRCNGKRLLAIHKKSHKAKRLHTCNLCGKHFNHSSSLSRHRHIHKGRAGRPELGGMMVAPPNAAMGKPKKKRGGRGGGRGKRGGGGGGGGGGVALAGVEGLEAAMGGGVAVSMVGGQKQYQCTQCDRVFRNSTALSKHQVAHVRQLLNSYTQDSKDPLAKSSDLKIRLKLCSRDKPNYYTLCKKNKRSKAAARARLAAATAAAAAAAAAHEDDHEDDGEGDGRGKQYNCGICRKRFVRLSNLKQHQQTHATGKLYTCLHCNKTFVHSSSFSRHKKVHSGDRAGAAGRLAGGKQRQKSHMVIDEQAPLESDSD